MKISEARYEIIAKSGEDSPRNDTASVIKLKNGNLMVAWHKYSNSKEGGSDFGICRIYSKISTNEGRSWEKERLLVDVEEGDLNVQAPALCMLPSGEILLICVRAHAQNSSTMVLYKSEDDGETFSEVTKVWEKSKGQWLQGGTTSLIYLKSGRLLIPCHGGYGTQGGQHNIAKCYISDDLGQTWRESEGIVDLPMRGAMEASVAQLAGGTLFMSLRTQLGAVFCSFSYDEGDNWTLPQTTGLKSGESCTCTRRFPTCDNLLLIWNDSQYVPGHHHFGARTPLSLAVSRDRGESWTKLGNIEEGDFEFTNLNCTFISSHTAIVTYMKVEDPGVLNGRVIDCRIPFKRTGMDLCSAVIKIED